MQIYINSIQKNNKDFSNEIDKYIKMSKKYAKVIDNVMFNDKIARAQSLGKKEALKAYDDVYDGRLKGYCIALDESGEMLESLEFAEILNNNLQISFFIGGAYGLSEKFKTKMDKIISLTRLTLAHKIAKLVLFEQIFRALCINANHPYHK